MDSFIRLEFACTSVWYFPGNWELSDPCSSVSSHKLASLRTQVEKAVESLRQLESSINVILLSLKSEDHCLRNIVGSLKEIIKSLEDKNGR